MHHFYTWAVSHWYPFTVIQPAALHCSIIHYRSVVCQRDTAVILQDQQWPVRKQICHCKVTWPHAWTVPTHLCFTCLFYFLFKNDLDQANMHKSIFWILMHLRAFLVVKWAVLVPQLTSETKLSNSTPPQLQVGLLTDIGFLLAPSVERLVTGLAYPSPLLVMRSPEFSSQHQNTFSFHIPLLSTPR